jgi:hypothetical protein
VGSYTCLAQGINQNTIGNGEVAVVTVTLSPSAGTSTSIGVTNTVGASLNADFYSLTGTEGTIAVSGPTISNVAATVSASAATITWTTDTAADSQVEYGNTASYGLSSVLNPALVILHSVTLSGLSATTTYHYRVKSKNAGGVLATSADFTFTTASGGPAYTLTAAPASVIPAGTVTVSWTAPPGSSASDWIALVPTGSPNAAFVWWKYTGGAPSGSAAVTAPATAGTYEFRYLPNNGYADVARSNTVTVGAGYTLTATPSTATPGATITVSWTASPGSSASDWIALVPTGSPNTAYVWWKYTGGATSGTAAVPAPATLGTYEFRYLLNNTYTDVARSNTTTVTAGYTLTATPLTASPGAIITVSWTAPSGGSASDWIALIPVGSPNSAYVWWKYTDGATKGTMAVPAPATAGTYEFRYLPSGGYTDVARSNPVTVTGYSLTATPPTVSPGAPITVSWTVPAGSSASDWIELVPIGGPNTAYGWWKYTGGVPSGTAVVPAPYTTGTYEFRYLPNNGYTDVARSNSISVR